MVGVENTTLISTQLPVHTHTVQVTNQSGSVAIGAANNDADQKTPVNNYAAITDNINIYSSTTDASLISSPVNVVGSITCGVSGNSQPHENRQPFLALNYIICQYGIFPSRN
jgi:microcystin-dependent protein